MCTGCSASRQVSRIHLVLSGIELHPGAVADESSPDWQEIAPNLAQEPMQVDLMENSALNTLLSSATVSGKVPAGTYYQLRLRLVDPSSSESSSLASRDFCGTASAGCIESADGVRHPLRSLDGSSYVHVETTFPMDLRDSQANVLHVELSPEWLLQNTPAGVLEVAPLLRARIASERMEAESGPERSGEAVWPN